MSDGECAKIEDHNGLLKYRSCNSPLNMISNTNMYWN